MTEPTVTNPPLLDGEWLSTLRGQVEAADGTLVCVDFDGTLAPIVEDPDDAAMAPGNEALLRRLADDPNIRVAVVSGRALADVRERVGIDGIYYAGNHGFEWDDGGGRTVSECVRATRPAMKRTVESLRAALTDVPGCTVEDKEFTATVHYRETPESQTVEVAETVRTTVEATDGIRCSSGKEILELRPAVQSGKDRVVERLRERYPGYFALFVGDDRTDEDAFRVVSEDGVGVLVGDRSDSAASVRVPDTDGVTMLLGWLVDTFVESPELSTR